MKKVLALVLALTMVLGMGSVALAEGNAQVFWYTMSDTYLASVRTALNAKLDEARHHLCGPGRQRHPDHSDRPDHHRYRHRHRPAGREHR